MGGGRSAAGEVYRWELVPDFPDVDEDGFVDAAVGGLDCDDSDADAWPTNPEVAGNLVDDDCDGWIDDLVILRGDLDHWRYDTALELGTTDADAFGFEAAADGDDVSLLFASTPYNIPMSGSGC